MISQSHQPLLQAIWHSSFFFLSWSQFDKNYRVDLSLEIIWRLVIFAVNMKLVLSAWFIVVCHCHQRPGSCLTATAGVLEGNVLVGDSGVPTPCWSTSVQHRDGTDRGIVVVALRSAGDVRIVCPLEELPPIQGIRGPGAVVVWNEIMKIQLSQETSRKFQWSP